MKGFKIVSLHLYPPFPSFPWRNGGDLVHEDVVDEYGLRSQSDGTDLEAQRPRESERLVHQGWATDAG